MGFCRGSRAVPRSTHGPKNLTQPRTGRRSRPCRRRVGAGRKMGGMTELAPSLVELARRFGIATGYEDWTGRRVLVPEATLVAVLAALGVVASTEQDRNTAL